MTSEQQQWRIPVKQPSIQVRLSLIFPFTLVRFALGLKQNPQNNDSNMPNLCDVLKKVWLKVIDEKPKFYLEWVYTARR